MTSSTAIQNYALGVVWYERTDGRRAVHAFTHDRRERQAGVMPSIGVIGEASVVRLRGDRTGGREAPRGAETMAGYLGRSEREIKRLTHAVFIGVIPRQRTRLRNLRE